MVRKSLGHYTIIRQVGSGGMGEVYSAEDPKLNRQVALKVLPEEMASQPERVARFEREAKAVAALDHPNIVTIHSVEEAEGVRFITMQLVEGDTLSNRIPKKGFSLEKFFELAIPMADAISTAHDHGITHRDLKPANVMVTDDGRVKVLDFGLAKLREEAAAEGPTVLPEEPLTEEGKIVGTVAYMSPEQAEGKPVDHRSDIFSLGIILYEMATGERPFKGDTKVSVMSSIVKDTPTSVTELNAAMPRHLGRIVRRCLAKGVEQRYQTAKDIRNELSELKSEIDSGDMIAPVQPVTGRRWVWPGVTGALVVALVLLLIVPGLFSGGDSNPMFDYVGAITDLPGRQRWPSLSHDGESVLFNDSRNGNEDIYMQGAVVGAVSHPLTEIYQSDDRHAAYGPNVIEERIAFHSEQQGGGIFTMGKTGETPRPLVQGSYFHPKWSPDGKWIVCTTNRVPSPYLLNQPYATLQLVDVQTQQVNLLYAEAEVDVVGPSWSPSGERIAFWSAPSGIRDIWTVSKSGEDPVPVTQDVHTDWGPFWSPDGHFLYFLSDRGSHGKPDLWRVRIDEITGKTLDEPEVVWAPAVGRVIEACISGDGRRIACTLETLGIAIAKAPFDPNAGAGQWEPVYRPRNNEDLNQLCLSPDGRYLAFHTRRGVEDVWVVPTEPNSIGGNLTEDLHNDRHITWYPKSDPDGGWLTFQSNRTGDYQVWAIRPNGTGIHQLTTVAGSNQPRWLDERRLVTFNGLYEFPEGLPTKEPVGLKGPGRRGVPQDASLHPDGELVAYRSSGGNLRIRSRIRSLNGEYRFDQTTNHRVLSQWGNRWFDDHRVIFWDTDRNGAFLWNTQTQTAAPVPNMGEDPAEFVFSPDGKAVYRLSRRVDSDIHLLELSK